MIKSLAYEDDIKTWDTDKDIISLDLTSTNFNAETVKNFPKLKRFRAAMCRELKEITFTNCPELEAVDLHTCAYLKKVEFIDCPNITAIDVSFSINLKSLSGNSFKNLRYLSACSTQIEKLVPMPSIQYLDIDFRNKIKFNLKDYPNLEDLTMNQNDISMEELLKHKHLERVTISYAKITSKSEKTVSKSLKYLQIGQNCTIVGPTPSSITVYDQNLIQGNIERETRRSNWKSAYLLLYGPWGIPPVDLTPRTDNVVPVCPHPEGINIEKAVDAIAGAIYGSAVMDMIGVGVEFWNTDEARIALRQPFDMTWSHPLVHAHSSHFLKGTPTDDTSQAILIMRSLISAQQKEPKENTFLAGPLNVDGEDFALRLIDWAKNGHAEHKHPGGLGLGRTVYTVSSLRDYPSNPIKCSKKVWIGSGQNAAANGAVMRNSPCGAMMFWDEKVVVKLAELFCKFTHYDPRCVFSCICAALLESRYIQKAAGMIPDVDIDATIREAKSLTEDIKNYEKSVTTYVNAKTVEELKLGEPYSIGYTLKALGAAIWALRYATSFTDGMEKILSQGGDSDTNGAVVGALLGAKFGFKGIPESTLKLMHTNEWIMKDLQAFLKIMDLPAPERIW